MRSPLPVLAASNRLTAAADFSRTVRRGRRSTSRTVVVHRLAAGPSDEERGTADEARVGFVVSKSVGGAVQRNRVKRRLRHVVREHLAALESGEFLVVRALPAAAGAETSELRSDVDRCLRGVR